MQGKEKKDWKKYYEQTKNSPPSKLLVKALEYMPNVAHAIDIGGGALKDTRFLIEKGFEVTVIDMDEALVHMVRELRQDRLHFFVTTFEDFNFPKNEFVLANANNALPFTAPDKFDVVFGKVKESLILGGIFCGQFFGVRHEWASSPKMTFLEIDRAKKLLEDMEVIQFDEIEEDRIAKNGTPTRWHAFDIIARKK